MTSAYLSLVHPDQALVDFGPGRNSADVPQLVGVFGKRSRLHLQKEKKKRETDKMFVENEERKNKK